LQWLPYPPWACNLGTEPYVQAPGAARLHPLWPQDTASLRPPSAPPHPSLTALGLRKAAFLFFFCFLESRSRGEGGLDAGVRYPFALCAERKASNIRDHEIPLPHVIKTRPSTRYILFFLSFPISPSFIYYVIYSSPPFPPLPAPRRKAHQSHPTNYRPAPFPSPPFPRKPRLAHPRRKDDTHQSPSGNPPTLPTHYSPHLPTYSTPFPKHRCIQRAPTPHPSKRCRSPTTTTDPFLSRSPAIATRPGSL